MGVSYLLPLLIITKKRGHKMEDIEKLRTLLHHWMEHNDEHARTYRDWAEKTSPINGELSGVLNQLYLETKKLKGLFEDAIRKIG